MKTVLVQCTPDHAAVRFLADEQELMHACAWMRVELPSLALVELEALVSYYHRAPQEIVTIVAHLSMVVTVFNNDDAPAQDVTVLDSLSCSLPPERVAPTKEPPWVIIAANHVSFCITGADPFDHSDMEFDIASVEVPYAALGLSVEALDEVCATR